MPPTGAVSTVFQRDGVAGDLRFGKEPDIALCSSDCVFFYVHSYVLREANANSLVTSGLNIAAGGLNIIFEAADVLNVVLHAIYSIPCIHFIPSLSVLEHALRRMENDSMDLCKFTNSSSSLSVALLSYIPSHPIQLYALVSHYNLENLAKYVSSYLLTLDLSTLTDELSEQMGSNYLRRLFLLHMDRKNVLKMCLRNPPLMHKPVPQCTYESQRSLQSAWAQCSAPFAWDSSASFKGMNGSKCAT